MIPRFRMYGGITKQFCGVFRILLSFRERNNYLFMVKLKPYTLPVIALYLQIFNTQNYTLF